VPVLVAVAVLRTLGRKDPFVRHHAAEAVNVQLWFLLSSISVGIAWFCLASPWFLWPPWLLGALGYGIFVLPWVGVLALALGFGVLSVIGATRSGQGRWWRAGFLPLRFVASPAGAHAGRAVARGSLLPTGSEAAR
jgi:Domain of unknown function (DUF4870)